MRILVTNDDGVQAAGIRRLARALVEAGYDDVIVVAPAEDMSGSSAALGPGHATGLAIERRSIDGLEAVEVHAVDGPPAMAVMAAQLGAFGDRPDLVVSGINHGGNTGRSVLFSGTVGAALAAAQFGSAGLAVSQRSGSPQLLDSAARVAVAAVRAMEGAPAATVLNVNVPNLPVEELSGIREAPLAPFGVVRTTLVAVGGDRLEFELRTTDEELAPDTDTVLVQRGFVTVTGLVGPRAVPASDLVQSIGPLAGHDAATA